MYKFKIQGPMKEIDFLSSDSSESSEQFCDS